jgi:hypothetical protein
MVCPDVCEGTPQHWWTGMRVMRFVAAISMPRSCRPSIFMPSGIYR